MHQHAYETACEHARELAKLKLWYVWWLQKHEGLDFETAVSRRVGLLRMTILWGDDPGDPKPADLDEWRRLLTDLRNLYEKHDGDATSDVFEAEAVALLWPFLEPAVERDLSVAAQWLKEGIGCFQYEFRPFYTEPSSEDYLTLHVRNAYQPDSPFKHFGQMVASLREITSRAKKERPDATMLQCGTWLNRLPPFAGLFAASWLKAAHPGAPGNHTGWWGQFMDRRGGFHSRNGRQFRETGEFPFSHLLCRCSIADLNAHLAVLGLSATRTQDAQ